MKEIMVAYWSGTGNTAAMATILGKAFRMAEQQQKLFLLKTSKQMISKIIRYSHSAAHPWEMKHLKKQ